MQNDIAQCTQPSGPSSWSGAYSVAYATALGHHRLSAAE